MTEDDRQAKLANLAHCKAQGEKAYDDMYDASSGATACYSDAKEAFHEAIKLAQELELRDEVDALKARLQHIKEVFRSQFT